MFAAPDGALVQICPGTYQETVTVDDSITIEGAGPNLTVWQPESGEMVFFNGESKITVVDSDFGFGAQEENLPDDVKSGGGSYGFYGDGVSFTCNGACTAP